jgi:L-ascorbate metabolism protein UlaG (beta-lactamase superfamily)
MAMKKSLMPKKIIWLGVLVVTALCVARAQTEAPAKKKEIQITWLGHAAFELVSPGGTDILIDPFLTKNPATPVELKDLSRYHPNFILVTHSHGDHLGDAVELAKMTTAKIVSVYMPEPFKKGELPRELSEPVNVGDHFTLGDVKVHVVPAMHSSEPSGRPVGFVVEFADGRSVYHQGDTWIFGDMALIQEFYHPNIIVMPVGAVAHGQSPRMAWIAVTLTSSRKLSFPCTTGLCPVHRPKRICVRSSEKIRA